MDREPIGFHAIKRRSVVDEIVDVFAEALLHGELRPGQRVPSEPELARQLGVGRSAVREAMKVLEALGVVSIQRGDGTHIAASPSSALLSPLVFALMVQAGTSSELLELRTLLEIGYCQLAARMASEEDWSRIAETSRSWEACAAQTRPDVDQLTRLDLDFHYAILDATHNPLVIKIGRTVEELFFASIRSVLSQVEGLEWGVEGHRAIVAALRDGDPVTIHEAVTRSLDFWGKELDASLHEETAVEAAG